MPILEFEVLGPPRPKERARVTKNGTFTPEKTKQYEKAVGTAAFVALHTQLKGKDSWFMETTYEVEMEAHFTPLVGRAKLPDLDNVLKSVLDGMEGVLYKDDTLVCAFKAKRLLNCKLARTAIRITAL